VPLVLDADGLNAFDGRGGELKPHGETTPFRVLTPHPGEAARLLGVPIQEIQSDRLAIARRISRDTGACVVLKGSRTVVAGLSHETWMNMSGNPALAKGGSGDVLSGIIGAALARRVPSHTLPQPGHDTSKEHRSERYPADVSAFLQDVRTAAAVHLHGMAADFARDELHENTVLATDVTAHLSAAFSECQLETDRGLFYLQR
jgi:NAD(P)H-hydrate epimerase